MIDQEQQSLKSQQHSHLLIVSHSSEEFLLLTDILKQYFPSSVHEISNNQQHETEHKLMIQNKYYRAMVKMHNLQWRNTQLWKYSAIISQSEGKEQKLKLSEKDYQNAEEKNQVKTYDLMIMLVNKHTEQTIDFSQLDTLIEQINPEEFVLLVNTQQPEEQWIFQETILEKCNNFIEIVKENLEKVRQYKPKWSRGALLRVKEYNGGNDEYQGEQNGDQCYGIFSILDRMETTRWATMVHNANKDKPVKKQQAITAQLQTSNIPQGKTINNSQQQQNAKRDQNQKSNQNQSSSDGEQQQQGQNQVQKLTQGILLNQKGKQQGNGKGQQEIDQEKLQEQMLQFEKMMSQMMAFKQQSEHMKDSQRKVKAEELFYRMFGNKMG